MIEKESTTLIINLKGMYFYIKGRNPTTSFQKLPHIKRNKANLHLLLSITKASKIFTLNFSLVRLMPLIGGS